MRASILGLAALAALLAPAAALGQQDYTERGLSVYAPKPVKPVRGGGAPVASTGVAAAPAANLPPPPPPGPQAQAIQQRAKAMLEEGLPRRLTVRNSSTGEQATVVYWVGGAYDHWELARISQLLRDHHQNDTVAIDWRLADLLWLVARMSGAESVDVHSGYRSEKTNTWLASMQAGVAPDSLHKTGKALDVSLPGVSPRTVAALAAALAWGGVGFYGDQGHVHLDVGAVRTWGP